jgi:hypothetical protein
MLLTTHCYVARSDILNEKTPFTSFPNKAEIQRQTSFEKL